MTNHSSFSLDRRALLIGAVVASASVIIPDGLVAAELVPTPGQTEGPFYPVAFPPDMDNDLVRVSGGDRNHPLSYDTCESCGGIFLESEFADATDAKVAVQEIVAFFKAFSAKKKLAAL